ncbi:MAG: AraC family transcriptional regulator, partial [Bacteroidales bacterium]
GTLIAGNKVTSFGNPDLVLTGPGLPHAWYEPKDSPKNKDRRVTVIHFKKEVIPLEWQKAVEFRSIAQLLSSSLKGIQFNEKTIKKLALYFRSFSEGQSVENFSLIVNLLRKLSLEEDYKILSNREVLVSDAMQDERFLAVHSFILNNFTSNINLSQAAEITNLSDSAFSHYFKKRTLKSFSEFIIDLRINHAGHLLLRTQKPVTEIAYLSGFNSISNFNNLFKRKNGITPHEFRKL